VESRTSASRDGPLQDSSDFSLVLGGPLFQLLRRAHLSDDALTLQRRRIVVISLVAWVPLLLLAAAGGQLLGGGAAMPFLLDVEVHVKFLLAIPLLIGAELVVHRRMRHVVRQFLDRQLIPESAKARFDAAVASAFRLRNSVVAEVLLIAFVYVVGILIVWRHYTALDAATWYATPSVGGSKLSLAGMWYGYVSLPFFQFLLCRWYFRLFIWARFLWQVSRIQLSLVPTHPDRTGGLGFVSGTAYAFALLAGAHGAPADEPLVGSGDIQSLADLGNSLEVVRTMRIAPVTKEAILQLLAATLAPIAPLADLTNSVNVVRGMRWIPAGRRLMMGLAASVIVPLLPLFFLKYPDRKSTRLNSSH